MGEVGHVALLKSALAAGWASLGSSGLESLVLFSCVSQPSFDMVSHNSRVSGQTRKALGLTAQASQLNLSLDIATFKTLIAAVSQMLSLTGACGMAQERGRERERERDSESESALRSW